MEDRVRFVGLFDCDELMIIQLFAGFVKINTCTSVMKERDGCVVYVFSLSRVKVRLGMLECMLACIKLVSRLFLLRGCEKIEQTADTTVLETASTEMVTGYMYCVVTGSCPLQQLSEEGGAVRRREKKREEALSESESSNVASRESASSLCALGVIKTSRLRHQDIKTSHALVHA